MKKIALLFLSVAMFSGCFLAGSSQSEPESATAPATADPRPCMQNFSYDGGFWSGRTYKTFASVQNVSKQDAVTRAAQLLTKDGWQVITADANTGIVSASQTVSYGNGKTVPINVILESQQSGLNVSVNYSTSGGVTSPLEAIQAQFCSIIAAVEGK
jgi:hypothetical protein